MKIIVPCCGQSSRYPNQPPKWMLPAADGVPMIRWAVSRLRYSPEDLVVTVLQEHDTKFGVVAGLRKVFPEGVTVVCLPERTRSQSETVAKTLQHLGTEGSFLVKDSDNCFEVEKIHQDFNYVCVDSLNNHEEINPRNKSYVSVDHTGLISNIREKRVISDQFNVGGYYFCSSQEFLRVYETISGTDSGREVYISDIIGWMIVHGVPFYAQPVKGYRDWGTIHEWRKFLQQRSAVFVSIDGFVFERGFEHFQPTFDQVKTHGKAAEALRGIVARGAVVIYLSVRPRALADLTYRQLREADLPEGQVVFDCPNARWSFVGAPHPVLPLSGFSGLEVDPLDPSLAEKIASL
jgi:hypothetical protein